MLLLLYVATMKIKFVDTNKKLVDKVRKNIPQFECIHGDIFEQEGVIVSASNADFTFGGWLDTLIAKKYPNECKEKQDKKWLNERIGNVIFTITVDNNLKSNKVLIREALQSIMMLWGESETILLSWLWTGIWWLSEDDFIDVLKDFFPTKAYKGMDKNMECRYKRYKIWEVYSEDKAILCDKWLHYCDRLEDVYKYYGKDCRIFEIEILGSVDFWLDKCCSTSIKIVKEVSDYWIKQHKSKTNTGNSNTGNSNTGDSNTGNSNTGNSNTGNSNTGDSNTGDSNTGYRNTGDKNTGYSNTGDKNTGDWNTGNRNTGDWNTGNSNTGYSNTGYRNTGDWNTGNRNTGDWNTGDRNTGNWNSWDKNSGYFNIDEPKIRIFWKETKVKDIEFPNYFYFDLCIWRDPNDMTPDEKKDNPLYWITEGYLKVYEYKDARKKSFDNASKEEIKKTIKLPNFDYGIFEEITWITKKMLSDRLK